MSVDKAAIQRQLEEGWEEIRGVVASLSDGEMTQPGVVEEWSVKDLLGHMAFWAHKAAGDLQLVAQGRPDDVDTPGSEQGTNEWNAREAVARKGKSLPEVRAEWEKSFEQARSALAEVPADGLALEVKGWSMLVRFQEDTYNHYKEHAEQIRAWKREIETTEA